MYLQDNRFVRSIISFCLCPTVMGGRLSWRNFPSWSMRTHRMTSWRNELVFFSNNEHPWTSGIHEFFHYVHLVPNIFQNEQQVVALKFQYHQWEVEIHCYQTVLSYPTNCNHPKIQQWKTTPSIPFDEMLNCGESTWISLSIRFCCNTTMTNNPLVYLRSIFRVDSNSWSCSAFGTTFIVARQLGL